MSPRVNAAIASQILTLNATRLMREIALAIPPLVEGCACSRLWQLHLRPETTGADVRSIIFSMVVWSAFCVWQAWKPARNVINGLATGTIRSRSGAVAKTVHRQVEPKLFQRYVVAQSLWVAFMMAAALVPLGAIAWR
jgi:hypothetical protein